MADEKVNVSSEEKKAPEAPAPSGPGEPPAPEHTEGPLLTQLQELTRGTANVTVSAPFYAAF